VAAEALALVRMRRRRLKNKTGADERFNWNVGVRPINKSIESGSFLDEKSARSGHRKIVSMFNGEN
jgi:hypothetical protein